MRPPETAARAFVPLTAAFLVAVAGCAGGGSTGRSSSPAGPKVVTASLPPADGFSALSSVGDRLMAWGSTSGSSGCHVTSAPLDPSTLERGPVAVAPCGEPAFGESPSAPDLVYDPTSSTEVLRVATRSAGGRVSTGPVLATFAAPAGDHPVSTAADGSTWVWGTPVTGGPGKVFELSNATGAVEAGVTLPGDDYGTPLVAADDDGLWLTLPPNTGPDAAPTPVYFVSATTARVTVTDLPARTAWWIVAEGHQAWIETLGAPGAAAVLWTHRSTGKWARLGAVGSAAETDDLDDAAVGGAEGLWSFARPLSSPTRGCPLLTTVDVVRIVPGATPRPVAAVTESPAVPCTTPLPDPGAVVYRGGFVYFLLPPDRLSRVRV